MATAPLPPFRGIEWDDELEKLPIVRQVLERGHFRVERWLKHRSTTTTLSLRIAEEFHRVMFADVFPEFAGRIRGPVPPQIPQTVTFGSFRSTPFDRVPEECRKLFENVDSLIRQLDLLRPGFDRHSFDEEVLKVAAYTHGELIRIHPFRNGNGRLARTCINYFAWRYGMLQVPYERPKGDYLDAIRTWLYRKRIEHFMDFLRPIWQRRPAE